VKGTLYTQTHTHTSKTIYSLAACLFFFLDNMVDQNKVEISEAKATELEKKVLTHGQTHAWVCTNDTDLN